mmetsp:Transcript_54031/g.125650  ORF Transcript_54031/g.125650 Transcript_54031/m.125650 type:complete len:104 (+) Transcript_54031:1866-2177(+)
MDRAARIRNRAAHEEGSGTNKLSSGPSAPLLQAVCHICTESSAAILIRPVDVLMDWVQSNLRHAACSAVSSCWYQQGRRSTSRSLSPGRPEPEGVVGHAVDEC